MQGKIALCIITPNDIIVLGTIFSVPKTIMSHLYVWIHLEISFERRSKVIPPYKREWTRDTLKGPPAEFYSCYTHGTMYSIHAEIELNSEAYTYSKNPPLSLSHHLSPLVSVS